MQITNRLFVDRWVYRVHLFPGMQEIPYPDGLKEKEIPLCARIVAVADVFDAVSEKRCYRDAMSLDQCFAIIREGSGKDFDPVIAEVFLDSGAKVAEIHSRISV